MGKSRATSGARWLAYLMVGLVLFSAIMLGANRPVSWIFLSLVALVGFGLYVLLFEQLKTLKRAWLPIVLYLVAIAWAAVQVVPGLPVDLLHPFWLNVDTVGYISADPGQGLHGILRLFAYGMVFWVVASVASDEDVALRLLQMIAIWSTVLALYGFYEISSGSNPIIGAEHDNNALQSTFVNRNNYATYAIFGMLANLTAYLQVSGALRSGQEGWAGATRNALEGFFGGAWLYGLGFIACLGAMTLTQSRAGGVAGLIALIAFVVMWQQKRRDGKSSFVNTGFVIAALIGFIAVTSASGLIQRLLFIDGEQGRFIAFPQVVAGIFDRPLLGHGLGAFHEAFRPYVPSAIAHGEWHAAHNSYLENLFDLGIPAAAALYLALGLITWRIIRGVRKRRDAREYPIFALACIIAGAAHSVFDFSLQMPAAAALFAIILGLGWAQSFRARERSG